jgi:hypothetical protein
MTNPEPAGSSPANESLSLPPAIDGDDRFAEFWDAYPRKVSKIHARRVWRSALRTGADPEQVIAAARAFADECRDRGTAKEFIPHPASWLNRRRYDDEPEPGNVSLPVTVPPRSTPLRAVRPPKGDDGDGERLLAAVIRLGGDQAHPVTAAQAIIDTIRAHLGAGEDGPLVPVTTARARELAAIPYPEYLESPEWQARRRLALRKAGHACQVCNRSRTLHVHHRTYERRGAELAGDLIVLCDECHALFHGKGLLADTP